jgi:hypothetical protein
MEISHRRNSRNISARSRNIGMKIHQMYGKRLYQT